VGKLLDRLIEAACAVAVVALTITVSLQVFNRFVLKTPLAWSRTWPCFSSNGWSSWGRLSGEAAAALRDRAGRPKIPGADAALGRVAYPGGDGHRGPRYDLPGVDDPHLQSNRTYPTMDLTYTWAFLPIRWPGCSSSSIWFSSRSAVGAGARTGKEATGDEHGSDRPPPRWLHLPARLNVPVAFSMVLACIAALWWQGTIPISTVTMKLYSGIDTFPFLAIPLFILAGALMEQGGISRGWCDWRATWSGTSGVPGICRGGVGDLLLRHLGSSIADASAIGSLLLPSMVRAGYSAARATAIVAAATGMGMMIPPCLNMVVLGAVANLSIAGLFMAVSFQVF